jgi:hypothetical protein
MTTLLFALSRTCNLADFPACVTVAAWQQALAEVAWALWQGEHHILTREQTRCVNLSGIPFRAPGPEAIYEYSPGGDGFLGDVERQLAAIWGIGVLDHIEAPLSFLTRARQVLRPQGLLFLTFTVWDCEGEDQAEGHTHRRRIYDVHSWQKLIREARRVGFAQFGGQDWTYHGHKLGTDHSLASLVLTRRGGAADGGADGGRPGC